MIKLVGSALNQFQLLTELLGQVFANSHIQIWVVQPFNDTDFLNGMAFTALIQISFVFMKVINPFKRLTATNRPSDR